jgi:hypothetical protein
LGKGDLMFWEKAALRIAVAERRHAQELAAFDLMKAAAL